MTSPFGFVGFSVDEEVESLTRKQHRSLTKRDDDVCVQCDGGKALVCSPCPEGQTCRITIPMDCKSCPMAICVDDPLASQTEEPSSGPGAGAIAGGVIGGLVAIAIITFLVWRFCIKTKRETYDQSNWQEGDEHSKEGVEKDFASRRSQRASTHTVNSIASTVLTRASNIIQIAYIPGVTNRATPTSPTVLVPPVPPIPLAHSESGCPSPYEDQHFFVPGDLRDSTYSGFSGVSDHSGRTSYAPRSSVASTIYSKGAVVSPQPAQKGTLLKPSLVSVKSRDGSSHSGSTTPPVPAVDHKKYDQRSPSPAFSIGATFFKNATTSTATPVRPQIVRVGSCAKQVGIKPKPSSPASEKTDRSEPLVEASGAKSERDSSAVTVIEDTPSVDQGPFADPPSNPTEQRHNISLSAVTEDADGRAAQSEKRNTSASNRGSSPFSDHHALKES